VIDSIEIIDLETPFLNCSDLATFPRLGFGAIGGLSSNKLPFLCGGSDPFPSNTCYTYEDSQWTESSSMKSKRAYAAASPSPFSNLDELFVVGGWNGFDFDALKSGEVYTNNSWHALYSLSPVLIMNHCMVLVNSTTVLMIGGEQNGTSYSSKTYFFNSEDNNWRDGPALKEGRNFPSCGKLKKDSQSSEYVVIVAGGADASSSITSIEVLEDGSSDWIEGPEFPIGISGASMVEDSNGGVIVVGGMFDDNSYSNKLFHLAHAKAEWVEMPQKLKVPRDYTTAFLVPDELTTCN